MSRRILKMRALFDRLLFGGTRELRAWEIACVEAWRKKLSTEGATVLKRQLSRFNLIQRSVDGKLVSFFDTKDKRYATWNSEDLFRLRSEEISAARIWLRPADRRQSEIKADVVLHRGRLSSIEFNKAPLHLGTHVEITKVETLIDPMGQGEAAVQIQVSEIPGEIQDWLRRMAATDLRKPLSNARSEEFRRSIDAKLPDDYMELVSATEGATINCCRIYGLLEIRRLVRPDGNFYLLAEATDGRALGVRQENIDAQIYIIGVDGEKPKAAGQSLLARIGDLRADPNGI